MTYGSLGAVVVLLTWLYLSSYVLLFGAELNSELERETLQDTTEGADRPAGSRGAAIADQVADDAGHTHGVVAGAEDNNRQREVDTAKPRSRVVDAALMGLGLLLVWLNDKRGAR